jgi:glycogen operon protein
MTDEEWQHEHARCLGVILSGEGMVEIDTRGRPVSDGTFLLLFNAHHEGIEFRLPGGEAGSRWLAVLDTTHEEGLARNGAFEAGGTYPLKGRSLALMQQQRA